ncbi:PQQ-like beta-propeller repeat protein [Roseococcus suduntuyensis]|uniref:Outer membrane protein assembly factor BamB n=1 Tax=Roseococcus suduntuyensis TaxID=455361 RepID=A0A840ADJ2_9PROT|nr:PQQ-like beta-propeller repeat protein [Roseococcus suduntuyensis]MBB3899679.1 outer membrane protein assembly factor BamB [Roseococcus suduntuyensis]
MDTPVNARPQGCRLWGRRAALLGAAALVAGCDTITDATDRLLGTRKEPLPGSRAPVLSAQRTLGVDASAQARPFTLPAPVVNTAWTTPGGNAGHAPGHLALARPLGEVWRSSIGTGTGYRQRMTAPPLVEGETVYAMDAMGRVSALDIARGSRRWQRDTRPEDSRGGALGGAMALHEGSLYVVTGMAEVMALDPATGEIRWRAPMPSAARGGIAVAGGRILVPNIENNVVAFSTQDGSRAWSFRGTPVQALMLGQPSPAVDGDIAVMGLASGEIVALRVADGRTVWTESLGMARSGAPSLSDISAITAMPVIDRGRVHVTSVGGTSASLDLRSGRRVWERDVGGPVTVAAAGDWVWLLSREAELICMGREDGRIRWITALPSFGDPDRRRDPILYGPPVLGGGRLLLTSSTGQAIEVDADAGEIIARSRLPSGCTLQPALALEGAYLLVDSGSVVALRGVG